MRSSKPWIASLECSPSIVEENSFSVILNWFEFITLAPCAQRLLFSAINLVLLLIFILSALKRLYSRFLAPNSTSLLQKPLIEAKNHRIRANLWFKFAFFAVGVLALAHSVVTILALNQGITFEWKLVDFLFNLVVAITNVLILVVLLHEKRLGAVSHPFSLRTYWALSLVVVCLSCATALIRLEWGTSQVLKFDDILSLITSPLYLFLFIVSIRGSTGISVSIVEDDSRQETGSYLSGYATASFFSKAIYQWMNPIMKKGYEAPLQMNDVPWLPPDEQAEAMARLFEEHWSEDSKNPVRTMLLRGFWKDLAITGSLAVTRLAVMYVGPLLINGFVSYTSREHQNVSEGVVLILILFFSKVVEVISSHQFSFLSQKLGMLIRSSLITALYKKGLRLSSSSRQAHGLGQIVNYMAVDCQQLSDLVYQLHTLWMMPFQVGIALVLLYTYLKASVFVSLVAVIVIMIITRVITQKTNFFQFNLMMGRDVRMKATTELLNNMRVIKFQAWEDHFNDKIHSARDDEFSWLSKFLYIIAANIVLLWSMPLALAALTFGVAILFGVPLDAGTVFTATSIFKILQEPIQSFPQTLISVSQAIISLERLDAYLTSNELKDNNVERNCDGGAVAVEVRQGTFAWDEQGEESVLVDLNFKVKKGELAAIVGTVGSGKSSLLASVLGELHKISGKVQVCGTTAYVAQTSWIQNATIQENILFGSPMENERYKNVIKVCSLQKDLEVMEHGDQTEIGERGINLSGGQKQRIQLARAVYQDCDIYLLDDVFSAVDAHTGTEIFKDCVRGALKDKTVLLVTHQVDFLHNADLILVMREGKIVQSGKYEELMQSGLDFSALVAAHEGSIELVETNTNGVLVNEKKETQSHPADDSGDTEVNHEPGPEKGNSKLIEDEEREMGRVSLTVYKQYCTEAFGWWGVIAVILTSVLWQAVQMSSDYWLAYETSNERNYSPLQFITVYSCIAVVSCILLSMRAFIFAFLGLKTARGFFDRILNSILHAPMSFFDTTPSGRILSRASSDQVNIDIMIPLFLNIVLNMYFSLFSTLVITCQYSWPTIFVLIPLIWINIYYQRYFIASSRELTRLDQITKAPIIHHFSETVSGAMTIRAFRNQDAFFDKSLEMVNSNLRMNFHNNGSSEWLGFRVEMIGCCLLCVSTVFIIFLPSSIIKPEYVGLSLSYGLPLNMLLYYAVYLGCMLENKMVSVERIKQFINIPSEAPWKNPDIAISPDWPNRGDINIRDLKVRYRHNTPLVLKGMSLSIDGGSKIGVVGRTGSGKSTLIQVLFRLVEPYSGRIIIDGVDICKMGLHDLRSSFGIIPQEPVLFQGTIRSNVDPLGLYSDDDIWMSLERCQLKDVVQAKPEKLDSLVVDSGDNWSVGQCQLLCLGRVMLKRSKILFMDEATASVDSKTDAVIQRIIRQDFSSCTVIIIAHRIPTVIECDRVLVVDDGLAKEFDSPSKLLEGPSLFGALVQEYANRSHGF